MPGEFRDLVQLVGVVRIGGVGVLAAVVAARLPLRLSSVSPFFATFVFFAPLPLLSFLSFLAPLAVPLAATAAFLASLPAFCSFSVPAVSSFFGGGVASFLAGTLGGDAGTMSAITFWRTMATTGQTRELPVVLGRIARSALAVGQRFRALLGSIRGDEVEPDFVAFAGESSRQQLNEFHVGAAGRSGGYPHVGWCDADVDGAIDAGADEERSQYRHQPRVAQEHPDPVANDVLQRIRYPWPCPMSGRTLRTRPRLVSLGRSAAKAKASWQGADGAAVSAAW